MFFNGVNISVFWNYQQNSITVLDFWRVNSGRQTVDGCHEEMAFTARTAALGEQDAVLQERLDEVARQNGEAIHPIDKKNEHLCFLLVV